MLRKYFTRDIWALLLLMLVKMVLQYQLIHPVYDLQRDEYLHLDQANHPAWGYLSVPPFISWNSMLIRYLGNSLFWVKFFPALFGALTIFFTWKIAEAMKGNFYAKLLAALAVFFSAILRINTLYQPNSFEILAWTAFYYALLRFLQTGKNGWVYTGAGIAAIGFLNKYNILFMLAGLAPALTISPWRNIFRNKHMYGAMVLFVLMVAPNILWQIQHDYPVIHHMDTLARLQLVNVERMGFLKDQLLFFINGIFIWIAAIIAFFRYPSFRPYRFLLWAFSVTIALYIYFHAKSYYSIGLYPLLLAFGAVYLEYLSRGKKWGWRILHLSVLLLGFLPLMQVAFPDKSPQQIMSDREPYRRLGLLKWEDGKDHDLPQDFADMLGWRELAGKVDAVWGRLPDSNNILVLCDNWGQAGAINYYSKHKPGAVSFDGDYIDWFPLGKTIRHAILVRDTTDEDPGRKVERAFCDSVWKEGEIADPNAREKGVAIYVLRNIRIDVWPRLKEEIRRTKQEER